MKNLKEARHLAGYAQAKLAEALSVSQQTISDYEHGKTNPDEETMVKIADLLNVSVDYLLGRTDDLGIFVTSRAEILLEEQQLLRAFRELSVHSKELVFDMIFSVFKMERKTDMT